MKKLLAGLLAAILLFSPCSVVFGETTEAAVAGAETTAAASREEMIAAAANALCRLAGNDRYETGLAVAQEMGGPFSAAVIACGTNFPDALSGSYLAQKLGAPMLIVSSSQSTCDKLISYLRENMTEGGQVFILGGSSVVPESFENALRSQIPSLQVSRLEGPTRFETNLKILEAASPDASEEILVCSGTNYPDALSVGSLGLPILLVKGQQLSAEQAAFIGARSGMVTLIGGSPAVSSEIEEQIRGLVGAERVRRVYGENRYETSLEILRTFPKGTQNLVVATGKNFPDGLCAGPFAASLDANIVLTADGNSLVEELEDYVLDAGIHKIYVAGGPPALSDEQLAGLDLAVRSICDRDTVNAYAESLYEENILEDYIHAEFTWDTEHRKYGWLYFNGFMLEAFLTKDLDHYQEWVRDFYRQHINSDGTIPKFHTGGLDYVMPAVGMIDLVNSGVLPPEEKELYISGIAYVYRQLQLQTTYPEAGNLYCHSQTSDGTPTKHWTKHNICLDGIYMSQVFLIRLAESIDRGTIAILDREGNPVTTESLWNDTYTRCVFVMENMRDPETGLLYHGYSTDRKESSGIPWSRGIGWFAMAYIEAAEKHPDPEKRAVLAAGFRDLMASLVQWQDPDTGLWYNAPDSREEVKGNRIETSGSSMFTYCLLRGYQNGLLDRSFRTAGLTAFTALAETKMSPEGLTDTLIGSGVTSTRENYQKGAFVTNEAKGVGGFIMAAQFIS